MAGSLQNQWPRWAGGRARAQWDAGLRAGGGERVGAPRCCCRRRSRRRSEEAMLYGVWGGGEEEEGVKPREETGERHHTHTAQDGRRGSSTPSCQAFRRGCGARWPARNCARAPRRLAGAKRPRLRRDRPRAEVGSRGRGARGGRARDAESAAAAAAAEAPRGPGCWTRRGRRPGAGIGCGRPQGSGSRARTR